ncbi:hypothetical protein, partial [Flavobacterium sp.]|uniref:hypothetical protein n=1 Tax=Flavobacterium sp. TaxID=239 RepID=UPI0022C4FF80
FWLYFKILFIKLMFFLHIFLKDNKFIGLNPFNPCHLWPIKRCVQTVGQQRHTLLFSFKKAKIQRMAGPMLAKEPVFPAP